MGMSADPWPCAFLCFEQQQEQLLVTEPRLSPTIIMPVRVREYPSSTARAYVYSSRFEVVSETSWPSSTDVTHCAEALGVQYARALC